MKRTLTFLLFSLFSALMIANSPLNFGMNFRLSMSRAALESKDWNEVWNDVDNSSENLQNIAGNSHTGYAGGVFLRFNKRESFLHTEAMFSFNCSGFTAIDEEGNDINYSTESTIFIVPIYLGRNIINSTAFTAHVFTGPQFAWVMNATATGSRDGYEIDDLDSDFRIDDFTWLWSAGVGIDVFMFSLDARYGFDIRGIEGASSLERSFNQKTNMFELTLGFKFF